MHDLRLPPHEISSLVGIDEQVAQAVAHGNHDALVESNLGFHEGIAQASQNALHIRFVRPIHRPVPLQDDSLCLSAPSGWRRRSPGPARQGDC